MAVRSEPIILIGAARSGTKFVRDLLATDPSIARVPYDINYVWRTGQQNAPDDALHPLSLTPKRIRTIRSAVNRLAERHGKDNDARIIEKTVSNCLRVPYVNQVFPEARYIHLVRDGRAVVESSLRLWQSPPDRESVLRKLRELPFESWDYVPWFALNYVRGRIQGRTGGEVWGPRYPGIADDVKRLSLIDIVVRQWVECVSRAAIALEALPSKQVLTVRYEDLVTSEDQVHRMCDFSGVPDHTMVLSSFRRLANSDNADKWRSALPEDTCRRIEETAAPELRQYGYL